jgi:tetratricopeptide (TPR) repeat protein
LIQRAVRAEPNNSSYLDSLGWVNFKLGKLDEAERYLRDAARRNPGSAAIQEHLGDLLNSRGLVEQARAAWQKALSLSTEPASSDKLKAKLNAANK